LPDFFATTYQNGENTYTKKPLNMPNGYKIDQKGHTIYQHLSSQDPPKFTQIGILGLKINHLATQVQRPGAKTTYAREV
jgi:hypothetical protein